MGWKLEVAGNSQVGTELALDEGPNPRIPGYGLFTWRVQDDDDDILYMPWIPVQQRQLVVPTQRRYRDEVEIVTFAYPGFTITATEIDLRDLQEPPFT